MISSTGIKLKGVTFNNPSLPRVVDYKQEIAMHPNCLGAWRFDRDDLIEEDSTGVNQIFNWKDGGAPMLLSGSEKATRFDSPLTGGKVAQFNDSGVYEAEGFTWDPNTPHTIVAVMKADYPSSHATAFGARMGQGEDLNAIIKTHTNHLGNTTGYSYYAILSYNGTDTVSIEYHDGVTETATVSATSTGTPWPLRISDANFPFEGQIDFVAIFNVDLANNLPELKARLDEYLRIRIGS